MIQVAARIKVLAVDIARLLDIMPYNLVR